MFKQFCIRLSYSFLDVVDSIQFNVHACPAVLLMAFMRKISFSNMKRRAVSLRQLHVKLLRVFSTDFFAAVQSKSQRYARFELRETD